MTSSTDNDGTSRPGSSPEGKPASSERRQTTIWEPEPTQSRAYMLQTGREDWATPPWLFARLDAEFHFTVDAAAGAGNHKVARYWDEATDGTRQSWVGERVWCNPPYSVGWLMKFSRCAFEATRVPGSLAVLLVPVKSDQPWWHSYAIQSEVRFIRGRVKFGGAEFGAPMPVCLLVFEHGRPAKMISMDEGQAELGM